MDTERKHYSFFQNRECEYFPCHKGIDPEEFNCLFCYCPLYALGRKCGGHFYFNQKGIKVCTGCTFPHRRDNYDAVIARYGDIADLTVNELRTDYLRAARYLAGNTDDGGTAGRVVCPSGKSRADHGSPGGWDPVSAVPSG